MGERGVGREKEETPPLEVTVQCSFLSKRQPQQQEQVTVDQVRVTPTTPTTHP